jgi:hypothetical protein
VEWWETLLETSESLETLWVFRWLLECPEFLCFEQKKLETFSPQFSQNRSTCDVVCDGAFGRHGSEHGQGVVDGLVFDLVSKMWHRKHPFARMHIIADKGRPLAQLLFVLCHQMRSSDALLRSAFQREHRLQRNHGWTVETLANGRLDGIVWIPVSILLNFFPKHKTSKINLHNDVLVSENENVVDPNATNIDDSEKLDFSIAVSSDLEKRHLRELFFRHESQLRQVGLHVIVGLVNDRQAARVSSWLMLRSSRKQRLWSCLRRHFRHLSHFVKKMQTKKKNFPLKPWFGEM